MKIHQGQVASPHGGNSILYDIRYEDTGKKLPVVLFVPGFKTYKDWGPFDLIADCFARAGFAFVKLSVSHSGVTAASPNKIMDLEAFGHAKMSVELDDLETMVELLHDSTENPCYDLMDFDRFYFVGHSRGGAMSILSAREFPCVAGIVCWTAISDIDLLWKRYQTWAWWLRGYVIEYDQWYDRDLKVYYTFAQDYNDNRERLHMPTAIKGLDVPLLLIHAEDDDTLPIQMAYDIKEWYPDTELVVLPKGRHLFGMTHPYSKKHLPEMTLDIVDRSIRFLKELSLYGG
jgi:pimeloyl-ACP methyl ester carboxylesterase